MPARHHHESARKRWQSRQRNDGGENDVDSDIDGKEDNEEEEICYTRISGNLEDYFEELEVLGEGTVGLVKKCRDIFVCLQAFWKFIILQTLFPIEPFINCNGINFQISFVVMSCNMLSYEVNSISRIC